MEDEEPQYPKPLKETEVRKPDGHFLLSFRWPATMWQLIPEIPKRKIYYEANKDGRDFF